MVFCLHGVLFTWCFVYMVFCLHGVLFTWCFVYMVFTHSVHDVFCLLFVKENTDFHKLIHFSKKTGCSGGGGVLISDNTGQRGVGV